MEKIKLQKYFSECGVLSRRAAEEEIAAGSVTVNGRKASPGDRVEPGVDRVVWRGRGIVWRERHRTVAAVNKPRGYVCTAKDEKGRRQVTDLTAELGKRLYPVGRLDMASEGLIFLTDDGDFANLMTGAAHGVPKVYRVSVRGNVDEKTLALLRSPMMLEGESRPTEPAEVYRVDRHGDITRLDITIREGRNRQIRRMCEAAELEVARLKRIMIGFVSVNGIAPGRYRLLDDGEVADLKRLARMTAEKSGGERDA